MEIVVVQTGVRDSGAERKTEPVKGSPVLKANVNANPEVADDLSSPFDPRFTFESFTVGKPNTLAHAAARRIIESNNVPFNPLFLHGGVGLGKTHLMHAIGWAMKKQRPDRNVMYLSAEKF